MKSTILNFALVSLVVTCSVFSISVYSQTGTGPNPYRDCGIGAALFPNTTWAAVSSNVIWDVGTTAVISATASPETCQGSSVQTAQFILDTYENIIEETAKGSGQHLTAMLNILGCNVNNHTQILSNVRSSMAESISAVSFVGQSPLEKASLYYDKLMVASSNNCS